MHWTAQGMVPVVYNNCKQSLSYRHCKSLCCTPEANIILYSKMYLSENYCWMLCISRRVDRYPAETWPPCVALESTLCCCCYCSGGSSWGEHDSRAPWAEGLAISCLSWKGWPGCLQEPVPGKDLGQPSMAGWHGAQGTGTLLFVCLWESADFPRRRLPTETSVCVPWKSGGGPSTLQRDPSWLTDPGSAETLCLRGWPSHGPESLQGSKDASLGSRVHAVIWTCPFWRWAQRVGSWVSMVGWELHGGGALLEVAMPWGEAEWAQCNVGGPAQVWLPSAAKSP